MFERYTEAARRTVFFARFEASKLVSGSIEAEHLLLGLLQEDRLVAQRLPVNEIRAAIARTFPGEQSISTSIDIPVSESGKRVLTAATEEAEKLNHPHIGTEHILLGLLREENTLAWKLLRQNGLDADLLRQEITERTREQVAEKRITGRLATPVQRLNGLIVKSGRQLRALPVFAEGEEPKETLGHLIDWATTHHQWIAHALSEPKLVAPGYPAQEWAGAQQYRSFSWLGLVELWSSMNTLLVHIFTIIPGEKLDTPCVIGSAPPISLAELITRYVAHCDETMTQILTRN